MSNQENKFWDTWKDVEKKPDPDSMGKYCYVQKGPLGTRTVYPGCVNTITETQYGNGPTITVEETNNITGKVIRTSTRPVILFDPLKDDEER